MLFLIKNAPPEERKTLLNKILTENESWICEGVYFQDWITPVIQQADIVLILKTSVLIHHYRVIKRSLRRMFHIEPQKYKETPLALFRLLCWSHVYDKKYLPQAMMKIIEAKTKYHIIKRKPKITSRFIKTKLKNIKTTGVEHIVTHLE